MLWRQAYFNVILQAIDELTAFSTGFWRKVELEMEAPNCFRRGRWTTTSEFIADQDQWVLTDGDQLALGVEKSMLNT
jgi:hypothetical protein